MAVKTLKIIFRNIFLNTNQSQIFFRELLVSLSSDKTPFFSSATKITLVSGFIF